MERRTFLKSAGTTIAALALPSLSVRHRRGLVVPDQHTNNLVSYVYAYLDGNRVEHAIWASEPDGLVEQLVMDDINPKYFKATRDGVPVTKTLSGDVWIMAKVEDTPLDVLRGYFAMRDRYGYPDSYASWEN